MKYLKSLKGEKNMNTERKNVVAGLYPRVSTDDQVREGFSLDDNWHGDDGLCAVYRGVIDPRYLYVYSKGKIVGRLLELKRVPSSGFD